jgi:hypothetical protein
MSDSKKQAFIEWLEKQTLTCGDDYFVNGFNTALDMVITKAKEML